MKHLKKFENIDTTNEEFFLDQDGSSHWYMIPVSLKDRWLELINRGEDDDEANDLVDSEFGKYRTGGGITNIYFTNPRKI